MVSARQHTISAESNVKLQARNTDYSVQKVRPTSVSALFGTKEWRET